MLQKVKRLVAAVIAAITITALLGSTSLFNTVALADGSLRRGDKGKEVEELQRLLKEHDCFNYDEITGYYGAATEDGVRKFQTQNGLKVDGIAGADTIAKLKQPKGTKLKNPDSLCLGMSGSKVADIQKRLKELGLYTEPEITGYFGPITEKAVKAFQEASGMKADGIVGKDTRTALFASFKSSTLIPGMKGESVKKLQNRLKELGYYDGSVTGLYGQITQDAVEYFQKLNGLTQDGICGKATYNAVFDKKAKTEKEARRKPPAKPKPTPKYQDVPGQSAKGQEQGQAIVDYAKKQLGKPYVYGAEGPNSFDCSGLSWFVYKHFGVTLPRSANSQGTANFGIKITDRKKLLPGDIVFFRNGGAPIHHAGIYVGGGNFIHAPYTGTVVRINSIMTARDFAWGKRVFK